MKTYTLEELTSRSVYDFEYLFILHAMGDANIPLESKKLEVSLIINGVEVPFDVALKLLNKQFEDEVMQKANALIRSKVRDIEEALNDIESKAKEMLDK